MDKKRQHLFGYTAAIAVGVCCALLVSPAPVYANPEGGVVASGEVTFAASDTKLDVFQTSDRALIDWRSFNIAAGEHTQFHQPSAASVTVNRILDVNPSTIAGRLSANGNIVLLNPNGLLFSNTAVVDVGGLVATTAHLDEAAFASGGLVFNPSGSQGAQIINHGYITAKEAGLVGLVAPYVENSGVITAKLGRVALASADTLSLDFYGDGLFEVAVTDQNLSQQILKNTGTLSAAGGSITLTAAAARDVIDSLIQVEGELHAPTIEQQGGQIVIRNETANGAIFANATIDASAADHGNGGEVILLAEGRTDFLGDIKAEGGSLSGDGGFVEVSGIDHLNFRGTVSTNAPYGNVGTLLLDPTDILITNTANLNVTAGTPFQPTLDDGPSILDVNTLIAALAASNVVVQTTATGTQAGNITLDAPLTWTANRALSLTAHNDVILNAPVSGRSSLTITASDVQINAPINRSTTGVFNVALQPRANNITVGVAGGAGAFNVSTAELGLIDIVNSTLTIGRTSSTATMNVGTHTWQQLNTTLRTSTGALNINGIQNTGTNNLTLRSRNSVINSDLIGTGNLTILPGTNLTVGIAGQAGTLQITTAELDHIIDGWNLLTFGTSGTQAMRIGAYNWRDSVRFLSTSGLMDVAGTQTVTGGNLEFVTRNLNISADLIGTGNLTIRPDTNIATGIAGAAGTLNVDNTELDHIIDGWNQIIFGTTGTQPLRVGARTWTDNVQFTNSTGLLDIQGTQNFGSNNVTLTTRNLGLNADLVGTGAVTIQPDGNVTMGVLGGAGTLQVTAAAIAHLTGGWQQFNFGRTNSNQQLQVGAATWTNDVAFRTGTGAITILGAQNLGANDLTFATSGNPALNAPIIGSGVLAFTLNATNMSIGLAGASGNVALSAAELNQIDNSWAEVRFGRPDATSGIVSNAYTWRWPTVFETLTGQVRFVQAQNFQNFDVAIRSDGDLRIDNTLTGTGNFTVTPQTVARTIGLAGGAGSININATELNRFADGWNNLTFGRADSTANITLNAYTNWRDPITLLNGTGQILLNGNQTALNNGSLNFAGNTRLNANRTLTTNSGDITFTTLLDGNAFSLTANSGAGALSFNNTQNLNNLTLTGQGLTLGGAVDGTGNFSFQQSTALDTLGLGGGVVDVLATGLGSLTSSWNTLVFGRADGGDVFNHQATFSAGVTVRTATDFANNIAATFADQLLVEAGGDITLNAAFTADGTGDALTLAGRDFINNAGSSALNAPYGRWLVYSDSPSSNVRGGLLPDFSEFNKTYPTAAAGAGNGLIYSTATAPTLNFKVDDATVEFGDAFTNFNLSLLSGLAVGDTLTNIGLTGAANFGTTYTAGDPVTGAALVGGLTATQGTWANPLGYQFNFQAGDLTVTKAPLTVSLVDPAPSIFQGQPTPSFDLQFAGFKLADTVADIDTLPTTSVAATGVGQFPITLVGGADTNYNLVFSSPLGTFEVKLSELPNTVAIVSQLPEAQGLSRRQARVSLGGDVFELSPTLKEQFALELLLERTSGYTGVLNIDPALARQFSL